ncbi:MAG TPA: hypothetical protein VM782_18160 [Stellaceae bacterium]|nr:hypothetical protein [Stellaceae bacterium]
MDALWLLLKDVALTGCGIALIVSQILAVHPDPALIVAGLALTVPSMATHAVNVLSGPQSPAPGGGEPSSPSSPPPGLPSSPGVSGAPPDEPGRAG